MGLYLPIPMDYLIMLFPNDWDISRGTHLDGCYWLLFATSTTTSPLHQHKCWLGEITPKITYGYGSIPINTILVGWTSIYQLFWCSPGVQGFDTLPYVCDLCHNSARSSWNDGCDTHYFKFGEGHRASVNLLANFSRLHMPWSKVFQMLNMNTYTYIYYLAILPTGDIIINSGHVCTLHIFELFDMNQQIQKRRPKIARGGAWEVAVALLAEARQTPGRWWSVTLPMTSPKMMVSTC